MVKHLLEYDPAKRLSAKQALDHPWIRKFTDKDPMDFVTLRKCLLNLRAFTSHSKLQQACLTFIATQLTTHDEQIKLRANFEGFDSNSDGQLSKHELVEGHIKIYGCVDKAELEVEEMM